MFLDSALILASFFLFSAQIIRPNSFDSIRNSSIFGATDISSTRVGFAIGRNGTNQEKSARRSGIRGLIDQLRGSGDLSEFQSARVTGSINGTPHVVDLLNDKFVEKTEVDVDRLNDPDASTEYADES